MCRLTNVVGGILSLTIFGWGLERVELLINPSDKAILEANPYFSDKVPATWIADGDTIPVSVSYRGAYSLKNLLTVANGPRNWKVKTSKTMTYRGLREWNFNLENHLREKMALDLYAAAGVISLPARHVEFYVNGIRSGIYLEFPDPDNKEWMTTAWGSSDGDLYKAATDIPGVPAFFGETTYLGDNDTNYYKHYQKKTNNDSIDSLDYSSIREFLTWVNQSTDSEFAQGLEARFDVPTFIRYLVVSNFAGHWDGFPNRGKNFWLYQSSVDSKWHFIPWDVDATFQPITYCLNNMGANAGLFFMNWPANYCPSTPETKARPLFTRMMAIEKWHNMYLGEYQKALSSYLSETVVNQHLDSLEALLLPAELNGEESYDFSYNMDQMRSFLDSRYSNVTTLLEPFPIYDPAAILKFSKREFSSTRQLLHFDLLGRIR